jgi:hypothetical protein
MRRHASLLLVLALIAGLFVSIHAPAQAAGKGVDLGGTIKAGYGIADATWHVGAGAGQYAAKSPQDPVTGAAGGSIDPHNHSLSQKDSYGVESRLSFRTVLVEDAEGDQVAFVKSDNYLAQDALQRRAAQILAEQGSNVSYDEIMHMASHNHFSPYYSSPSWGVWLFQDAYDIRAFEYQARAMAESIRNAELALQPARMGATEVNHYLFKGMVARRTVTDDGTPGGYPLDFGDFGLPVVRFEALDDGAPIAALINWGMHPEGAIKADNLITAEFLAPLERFVERTTGAPLVFGQGDVGSAESGPARPYEFPDGIFRQWDDAGHAQIERGAYLLAQDVIRAWNDIGSGNALVPFDSDFDIAAGNAFIPGPLSHPYPSVSNCKTSTTAGGAPGAPVAGVPDCERGDQKSKTDLIWENLKLHGIPVPDHYDAPAFTGVEENLRLRLQAFKLGEVIFMSCACEAQVDLILNLESRTNEVQDDQYLGYDWTKRLNCVQAPTPTDTGDWTCTRKADDPAAPRATFDTPLTFTDAEYDRMIAQIYNDARGWDEPGNIVAANSEPADTTKIWGNFTHEELSPDLGYKLPIGVGHAGDYNGYTVSYREYMAYDHYRKALTSYGPHTADYMNTTLMELARELNDGDDDNAYDFRDYDEARAEADEARQQTWTNALGQTSESLYDQWRATLPSDKGPAVAVGTAPRDIKRFDSTTFSWRGGSNAIDNPTVEVERLVDGGWVSFADQSGEIQTKVEFPKGVNGFANTYAGNQEWIWTANFEAFNAFPAGIGSTPAGEYRFVVDGLIRQGGEDTPYRLESASFDVSPWDGVTISGFALGQDGSVSFSAESKYPDFDEGAAFPYVRRKTQSETNNGELQNSERRSWCVTCSFRPWATSAPVVSATVTVVDENGTVVREVPATRGPDGKWHATTDLYRGEVAYIDTGDARDSYGETNGSRSETVAGDREPQNTTSPTAIQLTEDSASSGQFGDEATLRARLTSEGVPLADRSVEFQLGDRTLQAITNAEGIATATTTLSEDPGMYQLIARFVGEEGAYDASTSTPVEFVVEREDTALTLSSSGKGSKSQLHAVLSEDGNGLAGKTIDFFAGDTLIASVITDASGRASTEIPPRYRGGNQQYRATYSGDQYYKPSTAGPV